jgi:hypothetical protein
MQRDTHRLHCWDRYAPPAKDKVRLRAKSSENVNDLVRKRTLQKIPA